MGHRQCCGVVLQFLLGTENSSAQLWKVFVVPEIPVQSAEALWILNFSPDSPPSPQHCILSSSVNPHLCLYKPSGVSGLPGGPNLRTGPMGQSQQAI